jgi:hypothetical protein
VTAGERELSRADWQVELPLLLTRAQAAQLCQVSQEILDQWSYEPGFPVIRRNGGHFVRIHGTAWNAGLNSLPWRAILARCAATTRRRGLDECGRHPIADQATDGSMGAGRTQGMPRLHVPHSSAAAYLSGADTSGRRDELYGMERSTHSA